jgi:hypothetical protein
MRLIIISFTLILTLLGFGIFLLEKKNHHADQKKQDTTLESIQYLEKIDNKVLSLEAVKEIFSPKSSKMLSLNQLKSIYILRDLSQKTAIADDAIEYIQGLPDQDHQQLKLGLVYQDMNLINEARECWHSSPLPEAKYLMAHSFMTAYDYKNAYKIMKTDEIARSKSFKPLNLIYSLQLIQNLQEEAQNTAQRIETLFPNSLEWKLKQAIMKLSSGQYQDAHDVFAEMIFGQNLEVNSLATAYNARMYLFLTRVMMQGPDCYIDDILMAAKKDCRAIFDISGKSQYFQLFVDQKTIEKEMNFYQQFKAALLKKDPANYQVKAGGHIVQNFLNSRFLISTNRSLAAVSLMKQSEFNRRIDQIEGLHYGFLNSHNYLLNMAQVFTLSGRYKSSIKILKQIHRDNYSKASLALYNKNIAKLSSKNNSQTEAITNELTSKVNSLREITRINNIPELNNHLETKKTMLTEARRIAKTQPHEAIKIWKKLDAQKHSQASVDYALYLYSNKQKNRALAILNPYVNPKSTPREISLCLAWIHAQENDFDALKLCLTQLLESGDAEAIFILATKAYELKYYPEALQYSQSFILAKGNLEQAIIIKAKSALKIYESLPNTENKTLLEKTQAQLEELQMNKSPSMLCTLSEMNYSLQNHESSLAYARQANYQVLIKKNLARLLIKTIPDKWMSLLKEDQKLFSELELAYLEIAHLIHLQKYQEALVLAQQNDDPKFLNLKILCFYALGLDDKGTKLISLQENQGDIWQSLAQFYVKKHDYTRAASAYKKALSFDIDNPLLSNNYLSCLIKNQDNNLHLHEHQAQLNYKKAPIQQTLDTLVKILKLSNKNKALQALLADQDILDLEQQLILADTYKVKQPKQYKLMLTRLLTNRNLVWDETKKQEALKCLENITEDL